LQQLLSPFDARAQIARLFYQTNRHFMECPRMSRRAPIWGAGSRPIEKLACRGVELGLLKVTWSGYSAHSNPKHSMLDIVAESLLRPWQNKNAMGLWIMIGLLKAERHFAEIYRLIDRERQFIEGARYLRHRLCSVVCS
jgi:hypothetical protein